MASPAQLGEDLAALVRGVGRPLLRATALSHRGAPPVATAFRLEFAAGPPLKGSVLPDLDAAARVATLAPEVGPLLPRVIAQGGLAVLTEWIDGETLAGAECDEGLLRRCGAMHGDVHARGAAAEDPQRSAALWRRQLLEWLEVLVAADIVAETERAALASLALRHAPERSATGVSLGDYCAENIVSRAGALYLVDLETLRIAPYDYDLGRTWYRWPMGDAQRAAYLDGYRSHRDPQSFLDHLVFWRVVALAEGAVFRHRQHRPDLDVPVAELRALLQ